MKHIYVIRHGETEFNKTHRMQGRGINASLNEKGIQQAKSVSSFLKEKPITKIITSSLNRSIESAQPLCKQFDVEAEKHADLDEMDFGILEGRPFEEVKEDLRYLHEQWSSGNLDIATEKGESPIQVFERAGSKMKEILDSSEDEYIVFVLHGRLMRILLSEFLGLGLKNMHTIEHQNGAINHLIWDEKEFKAVELNITAHLDR
tara:strand:- start:4354 stop:4965 length:612 start_codon:yes stop_codon:yes gene_type:complete